MTWLTALRQRPGTGPGAGKYPLSPMTHDSFEDASLCVERDAHEKYELVLLLDLSGLPIDVVDEIRKLAGS